MYDTHSVSSLLNDKFLYEKKFKSKNIYFTLFLRYFKSDLKRKEKKLIKN